MPKKYLVGQSTLGSAHRGRQHLDDIDFSLLLNPNLPKSMNLPCKKKLHSSIPLNRFYNKYGVDWHNKYAKKN